MSSVRFWSLVGILTVALILGIPQRVTRGVRASPAPPPPDSAPAATALVHAVSGIVLIPGPAVALPVEVTNVSNFGAATVLITFDPTSVRAAACQRNAAFDVGLCNTAHDRNADGTPDAVLFNVVSLQGVSASETPVTLVNITWEAAAGVQPPASADLGVQVQTFTYTNANPLPVTAQDGSITIKAGPTPVPMRHVYLPLMLRATAGGSAAGPP